MEALKMNKKKMIETNELSPEMKASVKTRVITALVLAALCVPCLFLGGWFFFGLTFVVIILEAYELVHILDLKTKFKHIILVASILILLAIVFWIFVKNNVSQYVATGSLEFSWDNLLINNFNDVIVSTVIIMIAAGVFFGISFISEEFDVFKVCYLFAMVIIVGLTMQSVLYLRFSPLHQFAKVDGFDLYSPFFRYCQSAFLLIYVCLGVFANDIGAFFIGILFGKHKVNPRISPKKTWEGFYGGIAFSFIFSFGFAMITAALKVPMLPSMDLTHWYWPLVISFIMPIFANLGDFAFSAIKRTFKVKDFSNLLPGHGGILDRLDSILFTSGFVAVFLVFVNSNWSIFA